MKVTEALHTRHCISTHPPNPPFQPTRVNVWRVFILAASARAAERGRYVMKSIFLKLVRKFLLPVSLFGLVVSSSTYAANANNIQIYPVGSGAVLIVDSATGNVAFCNWSCGYRIGNVGASSSGFQVTPSAASGINYVYILNKQTGNLYKCYATPYSACQLSGNAGSM
jgi:hypothetical protein